MLRIPSKNARDQLDVRVQWDFFGKKYDSARTDISYILLIKSVNKEVDSG